MRLAPKKALALRQTFFEFTRSRTTHRPPHYHALGRKAVVKAVWEVDRRLAEVSNQFDYLLQLTPVNTRDAFAQFKRSQFEHVPEFHYRPLPVDTRLLKRQLYNIPIERVEDPVLERLFLEKQEELDTKLLAGNRVEEARDIEDAGFERSAGDHRRIEQIVGSGIGIVIVVGGGAVIGAEVDSGAGIVEDTVASN